MLLGVAGLVNGDCRKITTHVLDKAVELGFKTVQIRVDNPSNIEDKLVQRLKSLYSSRGFPIPQTVGNYGGGLIAEDEAERAATVKTLKRMINLTARLGSPNTYLRPGSLNPKGPWLPHPENFSEQTFDRLVDSTKKVCTVAANEGVRLATEGGIVCPIYSPERMKDLIDAVGSKALCFNMDPVNFIGSLEDAYNNKALIERFYSLLGDKIIGAHAKDFTIRESLLPSFEETIIGSPGAMLDQAAFLQGMQRVYPDAHVLIEHLPDKDVPLAADGLRKAADKAGISWD